MKVPPPHKPAGPKPKLSQRTLNVIRRQLEVEPRITSKELESRNPRLLAAGLCGGGTYHASSRAKFQSPTLNISQC